MLLIVIHQLDGWVELFLFSRLMMLCIFAGEIPPNGRLDEIRVQTPYRAG